jgi:hypothetical protein
MEREELLQEVQNVIEADGKQLSPSISTETINAELDDELENIGDDEEANNKVYNRIAKRLLRIDGNIHSNVSREVKAYKEKNPVPKPHKQETKVSETEESETLKLLKGLSDRLDNIERSRKDKADADAKNAAIETVKKGLKDLFEEAKIEVNDYIYRQTLRDLEIPDVEDGKRIDTDALVKKMERAYYRNLKEAGLDKKETAKPRFNTKQPSGGTSKLDEAFNRKHPNWNKKD